MAKKKKKVHDDKKRAIRANQKKSRIRKRREILSRNFSGIVNYVCEPVKMTKPKRDMEINTPKSMLPTIVPFLHLLSVAERRELIDIIVNLSSPILYRKFSLNGEEKAQIIPPDSHLLDFLQELNNEKEYTGEAILRKSSQGKGWRLHESSRKNATANVRQAIANAMKNWK